MNVWNGIESYPPDAEPVVVSIGNYDGVHLGHRAILDEVVSTANEREIPSLAKRAISLAIKCLPNGSK